MGSGAAASKPQRPPDLCWVRNRARTGNGSLERDQYRRSATRHDSGFRIIFEWGGEEDTVVFVDPIKNAIHFLCAGGENKSISRRRISIASRFLRVGRVW